MEIEAGKPIGESSNDDRMWALFAHLSGLVISIIGPLVIWLVKKEDSPFVEDQAKEALNFQLSVFIAALALTATCVGAILLPVVGVAALVYSILAGIEAQKGVLYRYPYTLRLVK